MSCPACGSRDIDFHEANGHSYCVSCGTVLEENAIVSSIEFQESGDRSHVIGQFVSQNCSQPFSANSRARGRFGTSNSRDITLANTRRVISQVAGNLHLPPLYIDRAYRLYQLALQKNFVFGRRQMHVVATCLYVICRQEKSPHLLIDFSDALQVNVFVLGKAYLQFIRLLSLRLPIVDPSLYIHRFAQRLELGPKVNAVATTALRIVTRMKKDWIILGRRPDGICACAMLVSCRAHGFAKAQSDIAKIFRVSGDTLRKRLDDFMATPSAQLTVEQFHFQDSNVEFDPPSFIRNQLITSLSDAAEQEKQNSLSLTSDTGADDDDDYVNAYLENLYPIECRKKPRIRMIFGEADEPDNHASETGSKYGFDDPDADADADRVNDSVCMFTDETGEGLLGNKLMIGDVEVMVPLPGTCRRSKNFSAVRARKEMSIRSLYSDLLDGLESAAQSTGSGAVSSEAGLPRLLDDAENDQVDVTAPSSLAQERHADQLQPKASTGRKRKIVDVDVDEEEDDDENDDEGEDEESGDDLGPESIKNDAVSGDQVNPYYEDVDGDIESYILSPEEQAKRASIWEKSFRGFVEERAARRAAKLAEEAARHGIILDENGTDSAGRSIAEYNASHNLYLTKTGKWRKKTQRRDLPVDNVSQAVLGGGHGNVLTPAVKSKKINYEVLKKAFGADGNFAVPEALLVNENDNSNMSTANAASGRGKPAPALSQTKKQPALSSEAAKAISGPGAGPSTETVAVLGPDHTEGGDADNEVDEYDEDEQEEYFRYRTDAAGDYDEDEYY